MLFLCVVRHHAMQTHEGEFLSSVLDREVSVKHHAAYALLPGKEPSIAIEQARVPARVLWC